jgi:alcohol dehydrogenase (cytochrome c)
MIRYLPMKAITLVAFALLAAAHAQIAPDFRQPPGKDWPLVGGDWGDTRSSTLAQMTPANIGNMKGAWMTRLNSGFGAGYSRQATPVVQNGVIYVPTGQQDVFALDAKMRLMALDQTTGHVVWKHELGEDVPKELRKYATAPPLYYNGLVFTTISGGDAGLRGRVTAHDAKTGAQKWTWYATPASGEPGSETWEGDSWRTGGGAVWVQPALDPDLGSLYLNTGNPWPDYNGSARGGDNPYTDSVVALDAMTRKFRWHYRTVRHDLWDFDLPTPPILFDLVYDGQIRKALAAHSKQGWVYILDRETGKLLLPVEDKPVPQKPVPVGDPTAPQCAEPVADYTRGCMYTPFWSDTKIAQLSAAGDWAPGAYDPRTGYPYFTAGVSTHKFSPTGRLSVVGARKYGLITALDSRTNRRVWQVEVPYLAGFGSGVLATAGGLLFHGGADGFMRAFDSKTGPEVWRFQTGFGADAPAATYEIDGEQYVAIAAGGSRDGYREARGDLVWSFKINGRANPLNGPPVPKPVVTVETPPNRPAEQ